VPDNPKCPKCKNVLLDRKDCFNPPIWKCDGCGSTFMNVPRGNPPKEDMMQQPHLSESSDWNGDIVMHCSCGETIKRHVEECWTFRCPKCNQGYQVVCHGMRLEEV
jgi:DNA-directed RNA polymerase subunit M/transcription elongation factor TFIIS